MQYPDFFNRVPAIALQDPLSDFLGAFEEGKLSISYLDCVKLAGHSCPTVAGAYLMALHGLDALYGSDLPQRGNIRVSMKNAEDEGVTGVMCNVISFIAGANGASGFKGLNGQMSRNNLVNYNTPMNGAVTLTRTDTHESVTLSYDPAIIPADPMMQALMGKCMQGQANDEEKKSFATLWQARVEKILLSQALWSQMITTTKG